MKIKFCLLFFSLPFLLFAQTNTLSMSEVEGRQEVSMNDVTGKNADGVYRYYEKGATEAFTGILYSNHPNGQVDSWQQFINGVGEGEWINYYDNGNYREIGNYDNNKVTGPIKKYYRNGILKAEGNYKDWRIRVGEWKYYDEQGKLTKTESYGDKGSIMEVNEYYNRGDIPYTWYSRILSDNGFETK